MTEDFATKYPEAAKVDAHRTELELLDNFITWLHDQDYSIAKWDDEYDELHTVDRVFSLPSTFLGIDTHKYAEEQYQMIREYRQALAEKEIVVVVTDKREEPS